MRKRNKSWVTSSVLPYQFGGAIYFVCGKLDELEMLHSGGKSGRQIIKTL